MKKYILLILIIPTFFSCRSAPVKDSPPYNSELWLQDYDKLKKLISTSYVNLEWSIEKRHLNLPQLDQMTAERLRSAKSDDDVFVILNAFIREFRDPHFILLRTKSPLNSVQDQPFLISKAESGNRACEMLGSGKFNSEFPFTPDSTDGFTRAHNFKSVFPVTTLKTKEGRVGFIRIPSFDQQDYLSLCAEEWDRYAKNIKTDQCDERCQENFLEGPLVNRILATFQEAIVKFKQKKVRALVVDLTNNGGGSGWDMAIAQVLTPKKLMCGPNADVRHPTTVARLEREITSDDLQARIEDAKRVCDFSAAWKDPNFAPACSMIIMGKQGYCETDKRYQFRRGLFSGEVIFLVNGRTASAAEDIVGRMQDNNAGKVIGLKTMGAGCGYVDGGIVADFPNIGLTVKMPNCARFHLNGINEIEGISPDITFPDSKIDVTNVLEAVAKLLN